MMSAATRILVMADGSSIHTEQWIKGLALSGDVELHLLTMNPAGIRKGIRDHPQVRSTHVFGSRAVAAQGGNYHYLAHVGKIRRVIRAIAPDVISTIYLTSYGFLGALCKQGAFLCHFMVGSDIMITPDRSLPGRWMTRFALVRGDYFVSASSTMTRRILQLAPGVADRLLTQQYGVDTGLLEYGDRKKEYDLVSNRAWVPNSNIPELLTVVGMLREPATFAVIGDGGPDETRIHQMIDDMPHVRHLGVLPFQENIDTVARSRFYLSLTSSDGASLSLMEAMALGAIPVVSDIEPNREWVEDGVNGFLLTIGDPAGASRKLGKILSLSDAECATMRAKNRTIIRERGSLAINMRRLLTNILSRLRNQGGP